jgi:hypothetical protein
MNVMWEPWLGPGIAAAAVLICWRRLGPLAEAARRPLPRVGVGMMVRRPGRGLLRVSIIFRLERGGQLGHALRDQLLAQLGPS